MNSNLTPNENFSKDIEEVLQYVTNKKLSSYVLLAVGGSVDDYYVSWDCSGYPPGLITALELLVLELKIRILSKTISDFAIVNPNQRSNKNQNKRSRYEDGG